MPRGKQGIIREGDVTARRRASDHQLLAVLDPVDLSRPLRIEQGKDSVVLLLIVRSLFLRRFLVARGRPGDLLEGHIGLPAVLKVKIEHEQGQDTGHQQELDIFIVQEPVQRGLGNRFFLFFLLFLRLPAFFLCFLPRFFFLQPFLLGLLPFSAKLVIELLHFLRGPPRHDHGTFNGIIIAGGMDDEAYPLLTAVFELGRQGKAEIGDIVSVCPDPVRDLGCVLRSFVVIHGKIGASRDSGEREQLIQDILGTFIETADRIDRAAAVFRFNQFKQFLIGHAQPAVIRPV